MKENKQAIINNTTNDDVGMPNQFPTKYAKIIKDNPEFKELADAASTDDLKAMLFTANSHLYTIEKEQEADTKLQGAKEIVKEYSSPYREAIKVQNAKAKYCLFLLDEKGVDLS